MYSKNIDHPDIAPRPYIVILRKPEMDVLNALTLSLS